jgi:hypothetical protein
LFYEDIVALVFLTDGVAFSFFAGTDGGRCHVIDVSLLLAVAD